MVANIDCANRVASSAAASAAIVSPGGPALVAGLGIVTAGVAVEVLVEQWVRHFGFKLIEVKTAVIDLSDLKHLDTRGYINNELSIVVDTPSHSYHRMLEFRQLLRFHWRRIGNRNLRRL